MNKIIFALLFVFAAKISAAPRVRFAKNVPALVVGGDEATPHEFPFLAAVQYFNSHICSAAIIRRDILLTSGTCAEVGPATSFTVIAGKHDISQEESTEQRRGLSSIVIHPGFPGANGFANDIAILKTDSPFVFNGAVAPVPLAHAGHTAVGNVTIMGWGSTTEEGPLVDILRKATVPVVTDASCRESYGASQIDDNMICAGFTQGGVDICDGDSGGPLIARDLGFNYLAGIVSFGFGCGRPGYPSVYSEVAWHIDFITNNSN